MADITYCMNMSCPFKDCDRHLCQVKNKNRNEMVSIAALDGTCRRYISYLVDEVMGDG